MPDDSKNIDKNTGSSDLWVTGDIPGARDSNKAVKLKYAVGEAAGVYHDGSLSTAN